MKMLNKVKMSVVGAVIAASLFSGASYALETGNVTYNSINGTCQPNPLTGYPWANEINYNVPIIVGNATVGGNNEYFLSLTSPIDAGAGAGVTEQAYTWLYTFNVTGSTYTLQASGISGSAAVSGTFTGSISANGFGGLTINLTLNCGAKLVGGTAFIGS